MEEEDCERMNEVGEFRLTCVGVEHEKLGARLGGRAVTCRSGRRKGGRSPAPAVVSDGLIAASYQVVLQ